jgi:hypothetical protein
LDCIVIGEGMKRITINVRPLLRAAEKAIPKEVVIKKSKLKQLVRKESESLKKHFKQKGAWDIDATGYASIVLYSLFKTHIEDYINYLILKELGPGISLKMCKSKHIKNTFWGFSKNKK